MSFSASRASSSLIGLLAKEEYRYGLDSSSAVVMTGDLENFVGLEVEATVPYDYPTIEALAKYLEEQKNLA